MTNRWECFSYSKKLRSLICSYIRHVDRIKQGTKHPCMGGIGKFKIIRIPTFHSVVKLSNPPEFSPQVLDPKKEQQFILNKFIKICGCKCPNLIIILLTYPINMYRLYLQSSETDSVESTMLPRCLTHSDHYTGNPLIETCSYLLLTLLPNLIHTIFFGLNNIANSLAYSNIIQ